MFKVFFLKIYPNTRIVRSGLILLSVFKVIISKYLPGFFILFVIVSFQSFFLGSGRVRLISIFFPLRTVFPKMEKSYSPAGEIVTTLCILSPGEPISLTLPGVISANFFTIPVTLNFMIPCAGSSVYASAVFTSFLPPYPLEFTFIFIFPSPPGGICLSKETRVHPHPVFTRLTCRTAFPLFLMVNSCVIMVPSGTGLNPNIRSGVKALGTEEAAVIFEKTITENNTYNTKTKYFFFMGISHFCCARQGIDFYRQPQN